MAKGLFHVSMIVDAGALYAVTTAAAANKARDVQINPVADTAGKKKDDTDEPRVSIKTILIPWWAKHKTFNMKELILFAAEHGYTNKGAVYTATFQALKNGLIQRTSPGDYKTLPAIKQTAKALAGANGSTHGNATSQRAAPEQHEIVHTDFVLSQISKGVVTYKTLIEAFVADGRKKRSIDGALGKLKADKKIANSGPGEYKLLAKGREQLKA